MSKKKESEWRLDSITLRYQGYGEDKGKYTGKIGFENKESESFQFEIRPDMAQAYIDLIAKEVVACASKLSERLIESLNIED